MKLIQVKYLPATGTKPARFSVSCTNGLFFRWIVSKNAISNRFAEFGIDPGTDINSPISACLAAFVYGSVFMTHESNQNYIHNAFFVGTGAQSNSDYFGWDCTGQTEPNPHTIDTFTVFNRASNGVVVQNKPANVTAGRVK